MHYIIMLFAIINPIVIMVAFVICIMTNMKKLKWLWILFIVFGIGNIALNWTTGQVMINPLSILLLGSGYSKMSQFSPLVINISIPLGAVLFLILRNKLKVAEPAKQGLEISSPSDSQDTSGESMKE